MTRVLRYLARRAYSARLIPLYLLNHFANHIPLVGVRMTVYQLFGVRFERRARTFFMMRSTILAPWKVTCGANTLVGGGCLLDARGGITIGRNVNISGDVRLITGSHHVDDPGFGPFFKPISIGDRAWLGTGATVLAGVSIGEGAVVGANTVVTRDVAAYDIVVGNPARVVRQRSRDLTYTLDSSPDWL